MKGLQKFTMVASRVVSIILFVGLCLTFVAFVASFFVIGWTNREIKAGRINSTKIEEYIRTYSDEEGVTALPEGSLDTFGKMSRFLKEDGTIRTSLIALLLVDAMANCAAFGMIFRNIYLIIKTSQGKTWFSAGNTPFQKDITRMIREIGISLFILTAVELILSMFCDYIDWHISNVFIGLLMLCLSGMFRYGEELQQEEDGLI